MFTVVAPSASLNLDTHFIKHPAATSFVTVIGGGMAGHSKIMPQGRAGMGDIAAPSGGYGVTACDGLGDLVRALLLNPLDLRGTNC